MTITADYAFALALAEGSEAATGAGHEFTNRDRRVIGEVLDAYGGAGAPFYGALHADAPVLRGRTVYFPRPRATGAS